MKVFSSGLRYHDRARSRLSRSPRSLPSSNMLLARGLTNKTIPDASCRVFSKRKLIRYGGPGNAATRSHFIGFHAHPPWHCGFCVTMRQIVALKPSQKLGCRTKAVFWTFLAYNEYTSRIALPGDFTPGAGFPS